MDFLKKGQRTGQNPPPWQCPKENETFLLMQIKLCHSRLNDHETIENLSYKRWNQTIWQNLDPGIRRLHRWCSCKRDIICKSNTHQTKQCLLSKQAKLEQIKQKPNPPSKVMFTGLCWENPTCVMVLLPGSCAHLQGFLFLFIIIFYFSFIFFLPGSCTHLQGFFYFHLSIFVFFKFYFLPPRLLYVYTPARFLVFFKVMVLLDGPNEYRFKIISNPPLIHSGHFFPRWIQHWNLNNDLIMFMEIEEPLMI